MTTPDKCEHGVPHEHATIYCPICLREAMRPWEEKKPK